MISKLKINKTTDQTSVGFTFEQSADPFFRVMGTASSPTTTTQTTTYSTHSVQGTTPVATESRSTTTYSLTSSSTTSSQTSSAGVYLPLAVVGMVVLASLIVILCRRRQIKTELF